MQHSTFNLPLSKALLLLFTTIFISSAGNTQFQQKNFMLGAYDAPPLFVSDVTVTTGDYNGDGRTELSTKTNSGPQTGRWRIEYGTGLKDFKKSGWSLSTSFIFGDSKSRAVPADYDGDGKTDYAVCLTNGDWRITYSSNSITKTFKTGIGVHNIPVPGDYDGNGCADISFYGNGIWFYYPSANKSVERTGITVSVANWKNITSSFGNSNSYPAQADYDGDGITDASLKTNETVAKSGTWMIKYSSSGNIKTFTLPKDNDKSQTLAAESFCAVADFNGDGKADPCVKTDAGKWFVLYSPTINLPSNNPWMIMADQHGEGHQFIPVPANYETGDKKADIAIYDVKTGVFHIDFSSNQFGLWDFATDEGKGGDDYRTDVLVQYDIENLNELKKAAFNLILGDTYYKGTRQKDYYLALMHHSNLKVMFADQGIYNHPFDALNGKNLLTHINSLKPMYREHIYAIDLGDEPTGCKAAQVKDWVKFFDTTRLNPTKIPVFYNLLPTYADPTFFSPDCSSSSSYMAYLSAFVSSDLHNSPPFISFDHYPFGENKLWRSDYFENLRLIRSKAKASGNKPFWATIGTNYSILKRKLTYEELKFSAFIPIAYGAKGIMYWTYHKFIDDNEQVYRSIQKINGYIKTIVAPVVMTHENIATLHKDNTSLNGTYYFSEEEKVVTSFNKVQSLVDDFNSNDIIVGIFSDKIKYTKTGYYYLWLVSQKTSSDDVLQNITITLNGNYSNRVKIAPSCDSYNKTSNPSYNAMTTVYNRLSNTTLITFPKLDAGEGRMVSIKKIEL